MEITWRVSSRDQERGECVLRSINSRYKIDRGMLRIVWEMEKSKNLHVQFMDVN